MTNKYQTIYLEKQKQTELERLIQASNSSNFMTEYGMNLALQIYFNPSFNKVLFFDEYDHGVTSNALAQLNYIRLSTSFIDSIYIYNHLREEYLISSSRTNMKLQSKELFFDQYINGLMNDQDYYMSNSIYNRKALFIPREMEFDSGNDNKVYTLIYKNAFNDSDLSSVIINISPLWFEKILFNNMNRTSQQDREYGDTEIIAVNSDNEIVMSNSHYDFKEDISDNDWYQRILETDKSSGYLISDINGKSTLINYYSSSLLEIDWLFLSFSPYVQITKEIHDLRYRIYIFTLFLILGSVLIEVFISRKLYQPIHRLLNTLETSQSGGEDYKQTLKNNFFRIYLQQKVPLSKEELLDEFNKFQIGLDINSPSTLILLKIDNYDSIKDNLSFKALSQTKYKILSTISENLTVCGYSHETVALQEKYLLIICNLPASESDLDIQRKELTEIVSKKRSAVYEKFSIHYSIFTSCFTFEPGRLQSVFSELMNAARKTIYFGRSEIITIEKFSDQDRVKFEYPQNKIDKIIDGLKKGQDVDEIKSLYDQLIEDAAKYSHKTVNYCITGLLLDINELMYFLKTYNDFKIEIVIEDLLDNVELFENFELINEQFYDIFQKIISHQSKSVNKNEQLVNEINEIVNENYSNHLFSISDISQKLDLTPAYIGRLYKKTTFMSFNEYLSDIRISKSKELLLNSDISVSDIAQKTGFTTGNYFHIVFKKKTGLTPQDYRKKNKYSKNP